MEINDEVISTIKQLRATKDTASRRQFAMLLAGFNDDRAFDELRRMAAGDIIEWRPKSWRTFWLRLPKGRYILDDQITGIEALVESKNPLVPGLLERMYSPAEDHPASRWGSEWTYAAHDHRSNGERIIVTYPKASGQLAKALSYSYKFDDSETGPTSDRNSILHDRISAVVSRAAQFSEKRP
jgi:hypothetical protein